LLNAFTLISTTSNVDYVFFTAQKHPRAWTIATKFFAVQNHYIHFKLNCTKECDHITSSNKQDSKTATLQTDKTEVCISQQFC